MSKQDEEFWKTLYPIINPCVAVANGGYSNYRPGQWSSDYDYKSKKRHSFVPILLIFSTAYNCEHCGAKQEDCKSDYCEPETPAPVVEDDGGWGNGGW